MSTARILSAIDHIVLQMDGQQLAVVIAPASVLVNAGLLRELNEARTAVLRSGRVRAIVRLPAGLLSHKPQQAQALWVLGASHAHVELAERWTMIADLSAVALGPVVIDDLVSDLVASLGTGAAVRAHAFRFARLVPTRTLLASRGALVAGARSLTGSDAAQGAALSVRVEQLLAAARGTDTDRPNSGTDATADLARIAAEPAVASGSLQGSRARISTIEQQIVGRHLRYLPGNRLESSDIVDRETDAAGFRVLGPAEVLGERPVGHRRIDRLRFAADYPAGRVTEPGDVVFCTSPRPAAIVDAAGTSVVAFPARILRIDAQDPNGLLAEVLAADIAVLPAGDRRWRRWRVRQVHHRQRQDLAQALASIRLQQERTRDRLAQLDELTSLLMTGVTAGTLTLTSESPVPELLNTTEGPR